MGMELDLLQEIGEKGYSAHCFCEHCKAIQKKIRMITSFYTTELPTPIPPPIPQAPPQKGVFKTVFGSKKVVDPVSIEEAQEQPQTFSKALKL